MKSTTLIRLQAMFWLGGAAGWFFFTYTAYTASFVDADMARSAVVLVASTLTLGFALGVGIGYALDVVEGDESFGVLAAQAAALVDDCTRREAQLVAGLNALDEREAELVAGLDAFNEREAKLVEREAAVAQREAAGARRRIPKRGRKCGEDVLRRKIDPCEVCDRVWCICAE